MTDNSQWQPSGSQWPGSGSTAVLPPAAPPDWISEPPPWSGSWLPPAQPGTGSGSGSGYGPPGWTPPPSPAPAPKTSGRGGLAVVIIAALLAASIGVFIGSRIDRSPASAALTPTVTTAPTVPGSTVTVPSFGGSSFGTGGATTPSTATPANVASIAAKVTPGIVDIDTQLAYQNDAAAGTGMVLTSNGEVLTNNHVVDGATSITATVVSTGRTYTASVVGTDPTQDVAVIQLHGASGLKTVPLGDSSTVAEGDEVVALGNAGGTGGAPQVVSGSVIGLDQTITASDEGGANPETLNGLIETDAPIQAGDSGGPLVNSNAQVIGMDTAASSTVRRFSSTGAAAAFSIPINEAVSIAKQIESGQGSNLIQIGPSGFLGIGVSPTSTNGALITDVASGTPASTAGLQAGESITSIDGTTISSSQDLTNVLKSHHPGSRVTVGYVDGNGASHSVSITLGTGPAN